MCKYSLFSNWASYVPSAMKRIHDTAIMEFGLII